jgi:hypothetical protein
MKVLKFNSHFKPNFILDRGTYIMILECDMCDLKSSRIERLRMIAISLDFPNILVIFIRYNSSSYINIWNIQISDSTGSNRRHNILLETIRNIEENPPTEMGLYVIYLFNQYCNGYKSFKVSEGILEKIEYDLEDKELKNTLRMK